MKQDIDRSSDLVLAQWGREGPDFASAKRSRVIALSLLVVAPLPGCAVQPLPQPVAGPSFTQPANTLFRTGEIHPGKLAYAGDRTPFAPILTEPFAYPTQAQAELTYHRAFGRSVVTAIPPSIGLAQSKLENPDSFAETGRPFPSIRLFGCKPGVFDSQTTDIVRLHAPVVHCATDFLDKDGQPQSRAIVNFAYHHGAWHLQATNPPRMPVAWRLRESSPRNPWFWLPGRERYQ